jgi:hypothetical protein
MESKSWWDYLLQGQSWGVPLSSLKNPGCEWPAPGEVDSALIALERMLEAERNGD